MPIVKDGTLTDKLTINSYKKYIKMSTSTNCTKYLSTTQVSVCPLYSA